jgi:hypothetical protein
MSSDADTARDSEGRGTASWNDNVEAGSTIHRYWAIGGWCHSAASGDVEGSGCAASTGGIMIRIQPSKTADTRSCDYANVTKQQLLDSSVQHINDVRKALDFFKMKLEEAADKHDPDKIDDISGFHDDFIHGFGVGHTDWWTRHRRINRHHLTMEDGIPLDVNLIDVLDFIADCVMAGMGRNGSVYPLKLDAELLERAFQNTVELLKSQVVVEETK